MIVGNQALTLALALATVLCGPALAFAPSNKCSHSSGQKTALSMSAALIVQNKGGGHGELGRIFLKLNSTIHVYSPSSHLLTFFLTFIERIPACQNSKIKPQNFINYNSTR